MSRLAAFCLIATLGCGLGLRMERKADSCAVFGCGAYQSGQACQCNTMCPQYNNCCSDFLAACPNSPAPAPVLPVPPSPGPTPGAPKSEMAVRYWGSLNVNSKSLVVRKMRSATRISYKGLWTFYKSAWVGLTGGCRNGIYDVYSLKCWSPGIEQCGNFRKEGDCYNKEHSWPKSWWGGRKNAAYSDVHHVFPSDGYVNNRRSALPFGTVTDAKYVSSEGHKVGKCSCGTCFEPTARTKGMLARAHLYFTLRYSGEIDATIESCSMPYILEWAKNYPPQAWEVEFNDRAQISQRNRNIFTDYPELVSSYFE